MARHQVLSPFTDTCDLIMTHFLTYPKIYHTSTTIAVLHNRPLSTIKNCVVVLVKNGYLTKYKNTHLHIMTLENANSWAEDYAKYLNVMEE